MPTYIGLLRAVNLPGHNRIGKSELSDLVAVAGMREPRTLLASGNVVFEGASRPTADIERALEQAAKKTLGLETDFFVRTVPEWKALIAANPFSREALTDPSHLLVVALKNVPGAAAVKALQQAIPGRE